MIGAGERHIAEILEKVNAPVILIINKTDTVEKDKILEFIDTYRKLFQFAEIIPCSALRHQNTDDIIPSIFKYLPYGPQFYDEDTITDQPMRQIVAEIIREKALYALNEEIPHGIAVVIDQMKDRPNAKIVDIDATIGSNARYELEQMLEQKVNLKLWVKVKKDWRDSDFLVKNFGYDKKKLDL